jgi:(1->4)-alpha-D-glucan 1-alpha-D-glucosylmutase
MSDDLVYQIAARVGVQRGYRDARGQHAESPLRAIAAVLQSLGYDVSSDSARAETIAGLQSRASALVAGSVPLTAGRPVRLPINADGEVAWSIIMETGGRREGKSHVEHIDGGRSIGIDPLPMGYHQLHVESGGRSAVATIIAAPEKCFLPEALARGGRGFGITAQVYGLRSATNYGIGDFSDVADLGEGAGRYGAAFLGLSPLHALFPVDRGKISPYSPSSRLFIDPIFIDPAQLRDFTASTAARYLNEAEVGAELDRLRAADLVEHGDSWAIKRVILGKYWGRFENSIDPAFAAFRAKAGEPLELHATFEALSEYFFAQGKHWSGEWPEPYRDAHGEAVRQFREANPQKIAFHAWLQWLADTQLAAAQTRATEAGMPIGLYRDLAVGVDRAGAEYWARPDWFVPGVAVGAPPDPLGPSGQNWGLPPFNPRTLEEQGLQAFRTLVAANMRHAGAIRIDHAFQLQRLYVVPDGMSATDGAYITYPFEAMLAVLRLESHRARSLVIAEDLGTAPEGFSEAIMRSDILSYRILNFEREHDGGFKAPSAYPRMALAAVGTHDLPTFAGWWKGLDTETRQSLGLQTSEQAQKERQDRVGEFMAFTNALASEQILRSEAVPVDPPIEEAFRYMAKTASILVALQLEDILEDTNQANLPGPDVGHPNWRRKLPRTVDAILAPGGLLASAASATLDEGRALSLNAPRLSWPPPAATYRIQFHKDFTFAHATDVLPYLRRLGVTHIYASPILKARPGSTHGYDTVDPREINPELGGLEGFEGFAAAIKSNRMELLLDIVPNHMGVGGSDNPWWLSVLEWGELSPFADTYDIDWERLGAYGKLVAPFLGGQYGETLEKGDLKLSFDKDEGSFSVWHFEHRFPICPLTYPRILDRAVAVDASESGDGIDGLLRVAEELRALGEEPAQHRHDIVAACERLKKRLALLARRENVAQTIQQAVDVFNGTPGLPESFGTLHRLLEQQAYRLSFWRVAASDVNYRRFFDIDGLAGVRIEKPAVFERTHQFIFELVRRGLIQGLRIDHIDGLADPKGYAADLQRAIGPNFYVVAEKILEPGEALRPWPLSGTTGYEMLNLIDGIFVDQDHKKAFDRIYKETSGVKETFDSMLLAAKRQVLLESFSSELESLVSDVKRIADSNRLTRDYSLNAIRIALGDLVCAFPVYRTYITSRSLETEDRVLLAAVVRDAKTISALPDRSVHDFLGSVMLGTIPTGRPGRASPALVARFRRRFQQLTGPVMAKSLEDTLFYRYVRFLALNEVGGEPSRFGVPVAEFHAHNKERARAWPQALTASSTHDTKRGEDARGRLLALSESPDLWAQALALWKAEAGTIESPDANDQYLFLQTILGVWPLELLEHDDPAVLAALRDRLAAYVPKALREAKRHSKWIEPNEAYETASVDLIHRLLENGSQFVTRLRPIMMDLALRGMLVSLGRTVLKCTVPGVPDFYQGTALWDFSLVDPDNRRAVDYAGRFALLREDVSLGELIGRWQDGAVKLRLTADLLRDRRDHALFYARADYEPLAVTGEKWTRLVAFSRRHKGETIAVVVPRVSGSGSATPAIPVGASYWGGTTVELAKGRWRDIFEGAMHESDGSVRVGALLETFPFAVLRMDG